MNEDQVEGILKSFPNATRAKDGVLIKDGDVTLHLTGIVTNSEFIELGEEAMYFSPVCSPDDIKKIISPTCSADFLLKVRAESIVDNPRLIRVFKKRKGGKKHWSLEGYYSNRERERSYLSSLSKGNQQKLKDIPAGSAYINSVNAMCMKTGKGNVIIVSEPLEYYLYFMNIFFYGERLGLQEEDTNSAFMIAQRIMAGYESFDFDLDPRGVLPESVEVWIQSLTDLQYQFILGHEYAHHLLGHVDDSKLVSEDMPELVLMNGTNRKIRHYKYSHKLEYDADWYSIKNIKGNASFKEEIANSAFLTLMYFDVAKRIKSFVNPSANNAHGSHPDPVNRIYKIRKKLNNRYGFPRDQLENNIDYLRDYTDQFITQYLIYNIEDFESYGSVYLPNYKKKLLIDRVDF